jgi:hypothetical protein
MFTGFVDGLMRRDLRKFGAGAKAALSITGLSERYTTADRALDHLPVLPFSLNPMAVFLPCAVMLGITTAITAATFKKYI